MLPAEQEYTPKILSQVEYKAKVRGSSSKLIRSVTQTGDNLYLATSSGKNALFSVNEQCVFRYDEAGNIQPIEYNYQLKFPFGKRKQTIIFDWERMKAQATYKGKTVELDIEPGYQVDLTMQMQLQQELVKGNTIYDVTVVRKHNTRDYRYQVSGIETLELDGTTYRALLTQRLSPRKQVNVWVNPEDNYTMLKTQIQSKKDPNIEIIYKRRII